MIQIVWFKKDLRIEDNSALVQAAKKGPILPLYVVEPKLWQQPDMSYRHYLFLQDCINDLNLQLKKYNACCVVRVGSICDVLSELTNTLVDVELWSHQETGNLWTYERDKSVARFTKANQSQAH